MAALLATPSKDPSIGVDDVPMTHDALPDGNWVFMTDLLRAISSGYRLANGRGGVKRRVVGLWSHYQLEAG